MLRRLVVLFLLAAPAHAIPFVISSGQVKQLQISGTADGTTHAVWTESIGGGQSLFSATFDPEGAPIGVSELRSKAGAFGRVALASSATETVAVWHERQSILGAYVGRDASMTSSPFIVAAELSEADSNLTITYSPTGFVAAWIAGGKGVSATIGRNGAAPAETIALPPQETSESTFEIKSLRIAVGANGGVAAADVVETLRCAAPPCGKENWVGIAQFGDGGEARVVDLVGFRGRTPDVSTDGRDFIAIWSTEGGIRERLIRDGAADADSLLFARHGWSPLIEWNGRGYTATWGYYEFGGTPRITVADISPAGAMAGPIRVGRAMVTPYAESLAISGLEAVAAWVDHMDGGGVAAVAQFVRDMSVAPPPPPRPIVSLRRESWYGEQLAIRHVTTGATAVSFEIISTDPKKSRVYTDRAEKNESFCPLQGGDVSVRVRALNAGGGSEPVELPIPPREGKRRAVVR